MKYALVHQFRVTLRDVEPAVWRRIQSPATYSFWDLHVAIQDSMGWLDYHLHAFRMKKSRGRKVFEIGLPGEYSEEMLEGWQTAVADYFTTPGATALGAKAHQRRLPTSHRSQLLTQPLAGFIMAKSQIGRGAGPSAA